MTIFIGKIRWRCLSNPLSIIFGKLSPKEITLLQTLKDKLSVKMSGLLLKYIKSKKTSKPSSFSLVLFVRMNTTKFSVVRVPRIYGKDYPP